ncbi:hypothetical protein CF141_04130 [Aeromonas hydrophila]|nr:hypothetical protein CF141_04130 [Aeromonas hydrophila]
MPICVAFGFNYFGFNYFGKIFWQFSFWMAYIKCYFMALAHTGGLFYFHALAFFIFSIETRNLLMTLNIVMNWMNLLVPIFVTTTNITITNIDNNITSKYD